MGLLFFVLMRLTVQQIMQQIASTVNLEAVAPAESDSDWSLWLSYINRSVNEWANAHEWSVLRKIYYPSITGTANATVPLPLDFSKFAGPVKNWSDEDSWSGDPKEFPIIDDSFTDMYNYDSHKYVRLIGDNASGRSLLFNPGTLASGASVEVTYFSMPTSLVSGTQYPVVPDPQFIVSRSIAFVLQARSDTRFQGLEVTAREALLGMIEADKTEKWANFSNQNYVTNATRKAGFRIGRN